MANRYAVATGNWSNPAIWDGGTLPQADDVVRPNGFTVTINQDVTVTELRNDVSAPAVAGGSFIVNAPTNRTITATLRSLGSIPFLLRLQSTGVVNLIGSCVISGPANAGGSCVSVEANCILNHTGIATGGNNVSNFGQTAPVFKVTSSSGCILNFAGTYAGGGTYDVTINSCIEVSTAAVVTINVTGVLVGGTQSTALWVRGAQSNITINGVIQASSSATAILVLPPQTQVITNSLTVSGTIINNNGVNAISSNVLKLTSGFSQSWAMQTENALVSKTLYSADLLTGYPLEAKVEDGTVYGPSNEFEGTLSPVNVNTQQLAEDLITELFNNGTPWATPQFVASAITAITPAP